MTIFEQDKKLTDFMNEIIALSEKNGLTYIGTVMTQEKDNARALPFVANANGDGYGDMATALASVAKMFYQYMIEEMHKTPTDARDEIHVATLSGLCLYDLNHYKPPMKTS